MTWTASGRAIEVEEAYGIGPFAINVVPSTATIYLSGADQASKDSHQETLVRNSDGTPAYSYERWIRVHFLGIFGRIRMLRFWADNFAPNPGWRITWGTEAVYRRPISTVSPIAVNGLAVSDPGEAFPNLGQRLDYNSNANRTDWIVLQVAWTAPSGPDQFQATPLKLSFKWREA